MGPVGPKTKNDCAGEGQQEFTSHTVRARPRISLMTHSELWQKSLALGPTGPGTKNDYASKTSSSLPKIETGLGQKDGHGSYSVWNQK